VSRLRRIPPVCVLAAVGAAFRGRLRLERRLIGTELVMPDGRTFRVFRQLTHAVDGSDGATAARPVTLVVRFRFARLSERWNRRLSLLPVPAIGGSPGFRHKLWMSDERGWWQGVYEWESARAADAYRASAVFRTMERRAAPGTLSTALLECPLDMWLDDPRPQERAIDLDALADR